MRIFELGQRVSFSYITYRGHKQETVECTGVVVGLPRIPMTGYVVHSEGRELYVLADEMTPLPEEVLRRRPTSPPSDEPAPSKLRREERGVRVAVYLPAELEQELRVHCAKSRRSLSDALTEAAALLLLRGDKP